MAGICLKTEGHQGLLNRVLFSLVFYLFEVIFAVKRVNNEVVFPGVEKMSDFLVIFPNILVCHVGI